MLGDIEKEVPHCKLTAGINIKLKDTSQRFNHISVQRKTNFKLTLVKSNFNKCLTMIRGGSRTAATSKMELLDVAAVLDPPLMMLTSTVNISVNFIKILMKMFVLINVLL